MTQLDPVSAGTLDPITVSWDVQTADLLDVGQLHKRWDWWSMRALVVVFAGMAFSMQATGADIWLWAPGYVFAVLLVLYQFVWIPRSIRNRIGTLQGAIDMVRLDEQGIHSDLADMHDWSEWSAVTDVVENANTIIIRRRGVVLAYVPKRAFATAADLESFLVYLQEHRPHLPDRED